MALVVSGGCSYVLPTGGLMAQVCRLGRKVGSCLELFCIRRMNQVNYGEFCVTVGSVTRTVGILTSRLKALAVNCVGHVPNSYSTGSLIRFLRRPLKTPQAMSSHASSCA